jgi:transcriptional regulator with XRE-family HTH domain
MSKVAKLQRKLLTEEEVRFVAQRFRQLMGAPMSGLMEQYGISLDDHFRFSPLAVRLEAIRIDRGLSLKDAAAALKAPRYRIADIERSRTRNIDPKLLVRYVEYLGLKYWFGRWKKRNAELAKRLQVAEAGNLTAGSRATRRKRRAPERGR